MKPTEPKTSRTQTDSKLRAERERAEEEVIDRSVALGEDSDEVIRRARERARAVLELAREREDDEMARMGATRAARAEIADARDEADSAVETEYAEADAVLADERELRRRAVLQLLALERDDTDRMLGAERVLADRLVEARDDTLATVSHDLRSHLTTVLMRTAGIITMYGHEPELVAHADVIQRSVALMDGLVTDLLDVAALENNSLRLDGARTNLVQVVADEIAVHTPVAHARSVELSHTIQGQPLLVEVDAMRIGRVFMNLIANAIKFTPARGRVDVLIARDGDDAVVTVKDNGPGIPVDKLETIFERFQQATPGRRGYGLGLYIARSIVTAHRGRIWAESTPGEGATFVVRLPLARP